MYSINWDTNIDIKRKKHNSLQWHIVDAEINNIDKVRIIVTPMVFILAVYRSNNRQLFPSVSFIFKDHGRPILLSKCPKISRQGAINAAVKFDRLSIQFIQFFLVIQFIHANQSTLPITIIAIG